MTVRYKSTDPSSNPYGRAVVFTSDDGATEFVQGDVIDIRRSLGRGPIEVTIVCASDATVTLRLNAYNRRYPVLPLAQKVGAWAPDIENEGTWINTTTSPQKIVGNSETLTLNEPIGDLYIEAITKGSGDGVVISAR